MLLQVDTNTLYAEKLRGAHLREFGIDERKLQDVLFRSLDRLFPDDEMILLMQSRRWREEPDLMAVDDGRDDDGQHNNMQERRFCRHAPPRRRWKPLFHSNASLRF